MGNNIYGSPFLTNGYNMIHNKFVSYCIRFALSIERMIAMNLSQMQYYKQQYGYSYDRLSQLTGIPKGTIQKIFTGVTKSPRYETLQALERVLKPENPSKAAESTKGPYMESRQFGVDAGVNQADRVCETAVPYGQKKQGEYTLEDYYALPEDKRYELIDGVLYEMTAPTTVHQIIALQMKDLTAGAVAGLKTVKNPINAAYAVKTKTPHVMLAGEGADRFAKSQGLEIVDNMYFATPKTLKWIEDLKKESKKNGTVGCVVLDKQGNLTAGTSTGGMFKKQWGRVGDSPVIGAGTYADNEGCAVSCTGHGEYFIRHVVAYNLSTRVKLLHQPVGEAADYIIHQELNTKEGNGGLIAVDKKGNFAMPFNSGGMFRGYLYKEKGTGKISKAVGIGKKMKTL